MNQCPLGPQVFRWGRFEFFENLRRYSRMMLMIFVNDTGDKLFTGINNTSNKFITGVVETGD
jgi:hypothetical protein